MIYYQIVKNKVIIKKAVQTKNNIVIRIKININKKII